MKQDSAVKIVLEDNVSIGLSLDLDIFQLDHLERTNLSSQLSNTLLLPISPHIQGPSKEEAVKILNLTVK